MTYSSDFARTLVEFLSNFGNGALRPERCDAYPPIREKFDPNDLSRPIHWLSQPGSGIDFKRTHVPRYIGTVHNWRHGNFWEDGCPEPIIGFPEPLFVLEWSLWMKPGKTRGTLTGDIMPFFKDLFQTSKGEFGLLCLEAEKERKNFQQIVEKNGLTQRYIGLDPEFCIPGVYFATIFGKLYVDWFGKDKFETVPCFKKEWLRDGSIYIQCSDDLSYYETPDGRHKADEIIDHLGRGAFFDLNLPNRTCDVPDEIKRSRKRTRPSWVD